MEYIKNHMGTDINNVKKRTGKYYYIKQNNVSSIQTQ